MPQSHTEEPPGHHEEETQNINSLITLKCNKSKATSSLFPSEMIPKLGTTLSTAQQKLQQQRIC